MKIKDYIQTQRGLWNTLGGITYEIDEENKCVNILDAKTFISYKWCEDKPNQVDVTDTIENTRKLKKIKEEITNE